MSIRLNKIKTSRSLSSKSRALPLPNPPPLPTKLPFHPPLLLLAFPTLSLPIRHVSRLPPGAHRQHDPDLPPHHRTPIRSSTNHRYIAMGVVPHPPRWHCGPPTSRKSCSSSLEDLNRVSRVGCARESAESFRGRGCYRGGVTRGWWEELLRSKDVIEEEIVVEQQLTLYVANVNNEACQSTETQPTARQPLRLATLVETSGICTPPYGIRRTTRGSATPW